MPRPPPLDAWGIDAAYSGTQKCLSCPPGLSPASFSERAVERARSRATPVQSWFLDLNLLAGYLGEDRVYHHTAPVSAILALDEGLRAVEEEGMAMRAERRFEPLVAPGIRLPMLTTVRLPDAVQRQGEAALRRRLLDHYGIELGGGLGSLAGRIWRIGLMGENARLANVEALLTALRRELS
jgi:alanine-glyoxylate transaminase/serine-glyoxylate transaminase/serine-pyruvate transaminase